MDKFHEGGIVYHKATDLKCVIIKINSDNTIKVRNANDEEKDYFSQELETEEEIRVKDDAELAEVNRVNAERVRSLDPY